MTRGRRRWTPGRAGTTRCLRRRGMWGWAPWADDARGTTRQLRALKGTTEALEGGRTTRSWRLGVCASVQRRVAAARAHKETRCELYELERSSSTRAFESIMELVQPRPSRMKQIPVLLRPFDKKRQHVMETQLQFHDGDVSGL
uniref:Uncharacterized protein n=1 Tax=Hyaloperonospora arabidopsidis (strain Emoy2) TaxID=559515 RepID=M4BT23_HYAAE